MHSLLISMMFHLLLSMCISIMLSRTTVYAVRLKNDKNVIDICMDGRHHLHKPVKTELYGVCKAWESNSCCSNETAIHLQHPFSPLYNLNRTHCGNMSDKCLRRFYLSDCFYECSPNVGPWLRPVKSSIRNERFSNVPFCKSDCDAWWEDCKDELTCVDTFAGFDWINGTNHCPVNNTCQSFTKWFHNATNFCQTIFIEDFKVVPDNSSACMKMDFQNSLNPNAKVSRDYAKKMNLWDGIDVTTALTSTRPVAVNTSENHTVKPYVTPYKKPLIQQTGTLIFVVFIVLVLVAVLIGTVICKCKNKVPIYRGSLPGFSWFKRGRAGRSVVHHPAPTDDRPFLQDDGDEADCDLNPHGTLEIDL